MVIKLIHSTRNKQNTVFRLVNGYFNVYMHKKNSNSRTTCIKQNKHMSFLIVIVQAH